LLLLLRLESKSKKGKIEATPATSTKDDKTAKITTIRKDKRSFFDNNLNNNFMYFNAIS
jgi:hypothetical protein